MSFDLQPVLKGELLTLRPLKEEDREELYAAASDPLIWEQHPQPERYKRPVFDIYFDSGLASKGALLVLDTKTEQVLGASRYSDWDPSTKSVMIGHTFLSRICWGRSYNREMKELMIEHAFLYVETVRFLIWEHNGRSRKAIEGIGAQFLKREKFTDGSENYSDIYQLARTQGMPI